MEKKETKQEFENVVDEVNVEKTSKIKKIAKTGLKILGVGIGIFGLYKAGGHIARKNFAIGAAAATLSERVPESKRDMVSRETGINLSKMREASNKYQENLVNNGHSDWFED